MPSPRRQRWLILAHAFNMDGRAASQTITDKIPYLLDAGIELVVLSGIMGSQDQRFEHHRLWSSGPSGIRFELRHVLRERSFHPALYRLCMVVASLMLLPAMLIERVLHPVENSWSWQFSAVRRARTLARQRPFDVVYSTGGAVAAHLAAHRLQQEWGIPWLAEVHDPLVQPGTQPSSRREQFFANVESLICNQANAAVWFTQQALDSARRRNPALGERGHMMLPGVDSPFPGPLPDYRPGPRLVIGHFGSLSITRTLKPFMHAWHWLEQHEPAMSRDLELHIYGGTIDSTSQQLAAEWGLLDRIRPFGRIETDPVTGESGRQQVLRRMRQCDVLLLVHGEGAICEEYIPSKVYEYLWMQRPILATVHDNPQMAEILRGQGHWVAQSSLSQGGSELAAPEMAQHLKKLWQQWRTTGLSDSGRISPYTTQASTHQLVTWAGSMDRVTS
jgi:hypothetical protein